jgi:hypothetical protein
VAEKPAILFGKLLLFTSLSFVIARSVSDVAIHLSLCGQDGLPRYRSQ